MNNGAVVLMLLVVLLVYLPSKRKVKGHMSSTGVSRERVMLHEKGHQKAFRRAGAGSSRIKVWQTAGGGYAGECTVNSTAKWNKVPTSSAIAVMAAGRHAAPGTISSPDEANIRRISYEVPPGQRASVIAEGEIKASKWCR